MLDSQGAKHTMVLKYRLPNRPTGAMQIRGEREGRYSRMPYDNLLRLPFHIVINHFFVPLPHFEWLIPALKPNSCRLCILKVRELANLQPLRSPITYVWEGFHTHIYTQSGTNTHAHTPVSWAAQTHGLMINGKVTVMSLPLHCPSLRCPFLQKVQ